MEQEKKYFIYYNNGMFEISTRMSVTLLHMVDVGVIKIIFDCQENKAWVRTEDGSSKEVKVTSVNGLT